MPPHRNHPATIGHTLFVRAVIYDSGPFVALASKQESHYQEALNCANELARRMLPTFVTTATIHEAHRRILHAYGRARARTFIGAVRDGSISIIRATAEEESQALGILDHYSYVLLTLTDALNVAVMLSRGIGRIFSFDDDYLQVGVPRVPPL